MNRFCKAFFAVGIALLPAVAFAASGADPHAAAGHGASDDHAHHAATISSLGWPLVNFLIYVSLLLYMFKRFAAPALLDRAASFEQHLRRARQVLDDAEREVRQLQDRLKGIREEQDAIRSRLTHEGEQLAAHAVAQAEQTASNIEKDVSRRVARELHVASADVKQQVIRRATDLARAELASGLSDQDDHRLRQEAVKGLF